MNNTDSIKLKIPNTTKSVQYPSKREHLFHTSPFFKHSPRLNKTNLNLARDPRKNGGQVCQNELFCESGQADCGVT